jgi:hypothetical protein
VSGSLALPNSPTVGLNLYGSYGNGYYDLINYTGTPIANPSAAFGTGNGAETYAFSTLTTGGTNNELIVNVSVVSLNWTGLTWVGENWSVVV